MTTMSALPFCVVSFENTSGTISFRVTGSWKGARIRRNFAQRANAEAFCNGKNAEALKAQAEGPLIRLVQTRLDDREIAAAESGIERANGRWPLSVIIMSGISTLEVRDNAPKPQLIAELFTEWLLVVEPEVGGRWFDDIKSRGQAFINIHPELSTATFDRILFRTYLDRRNIEPQTKANIRNVVHRFGAWLVERGHLKENPGAGIWISRKGGKKNPDGTRALPAVFTPLQAKSWLLAVETAECRRLKGWAVLCLLCGLRPENEAPRLLWPEINLKAGTLRVLGTKRGQKPRLIKLQPTALEWLRSAKRDDEATPGFYARHLRLRAVEIANAWLAKHYTSEAPIVWEGDIQRHSYASYRSGQGLDVQSLAGEMGNSPDVIYSFYRNPRTPAEVKEFWAIRPVETDR